MGSKDEEEQNESLEERLTKNVFDHSLRNDILVLSVWGSLQKVRLGILSGQSKSCERVHDKIDPQKLDSSKWRLPHNHSTDEGSDQSHNVDSELELQELSDVVVDISTPHASLDD
jgi:hypothetical protein